MRIYKSENWRMRVVERDGEPWFVAADTYPVLGIDSKTVRYYVARKEVADVPAGEIGAREGRNRLIISVRGLNSLLRHYNAKKAREFRRWIHDTILPEYEQEANPASTIIDRIIATPEFGIRLLTELKAEREKRMAAEAKAKESQPTDNMVGEFARWLAANYKAESA